MKIKRINKQNIEGSYTASFIAAIISMVLCVITEIITLIIYQPIHTRFWIGIALTGFFYICMLLFFNMTEHARTQMQLLSIEEDLKCLIGKKQK